jgi:hypothetical protein
MNYEKPIRISRVKGKCDLRVGSCQEANESRD